MEFKFPINFLLIYFWVLVNDHRVYGTDQWELTSYKLASSENNVQYRAPLLILQFLLNRPCCTALQYFSNQRRRYKWGELLLMSCNSRAPYTHFSFLFFWLTKSLFMVWLKSSRDTVVSSTLFCVRCDNVIIIQILYYFCSGW